jgi:hypothetical protein
MKSLLFWKSPERCYRVHNPSVSSREVSDIVRGQNLIQGRWLFIDFESDTAHSQFAITGFGLVYERGLRDRHWWNFARGDRCRRFPLGEDTCLWLTLICPFSKEPGKIPLGSSS